MTSFFKKILSNDDSGLSIINMSCLITSSISCSKLNSERSPIITFNSVDNIIPSSVAWLYLHPGKACSKQHVVVCESGWKPHHLAYRFNDINNGVYLDVHFSFTVSRSPAPTLQYLLEQADNVTAKNLYSYIYHMFKSCPRSRVGTPGDYSYINHRDEMWRRPISLYIPFFLYTFNFLPYNLYTFSTIFSPSQQHEEN